MPRGRSNESDPPQRYTVPEEIQQKKRHDYFLLKEFLNAVVAQIMANLMEEYDVAISFFFLTGLKCGKYSNWL